MKRNLRKIKKYKKSSKVEEVPVNWPASRYFKKLKKETNGMNLFELLRHIASK